MVYAVALRTAASGLRHPALLNRRVVPVALVAALFTIPYMATQSFIVAIVEARGLDVSVSLFFPVYAVVLLVLRRVLGHAFDTVRFRVFLAASSACALGAFALLTVMHGNGAFFAAAALMAGGYGVMCSVCQSTAVRLVEPARVGLANSTYYMGFDLGASLGSVVGGLLFGNFSLELFYPILSLTVPLVLVVYTCSNGLRSQ